METLRALLGDEIEDASEETFDLFSQPLPSQDLGMLDPKSQTVEVTIGGRDFSIKQSPGVLQSYREGGTTGAALWRTSVRFAEWLATERNTFFQHGVLGSDSTVLELGAGIAGLTSSVLASRVRKVVATDQQYALKLLKENIETNAPRAKATKHARHSEVVEVAALDWETDSIHGFLATHGLTSGVDAIVACDCVYNYALIKPLAEACTEICQARQQDGQENILRPTVVLIAQQLRQPEVFEEWLETFMRSLRVWRLPAEILGQNLAESSGFCVHFAALK